jgi:ABC-2 type transport system ATP-binding protein
MAAEGVTVLVTTHYMDEAEYCHRLILIFQGRIVASGSPLELKRREMTGDVLLVECDDLGFALDLLQKNPEVQDAAVFGNALHLVVSEAAAGMAPLRAYLSTNGVIVTKMEPIRPTLEDVFVSLTANQGKSGKE